MTRTLRSLCVLLVAGACASSEPEAGTSSETSSGGAEVGPASTGSSGSSTSVEASSSTGASATSTGTEGSGQSESSVDSSGGGPTIDPIDCRDASDGIVTLTFVNGCNDVLSFRGSDIDGGELEPGAHQCVDLGDAIAPISAIRFWGFVGPDPGGEHHTLAELTLNTDFNDFDWYNISHVDAHNLAMAIVPFEMDDCRTLSCPADLLPGCPEVGAFFVDDTLVACVSPERDNPDSIVAQYFESSCDDAYSWSGDDAESVATCAGEDFDIVFCP